jgi:AcrR family transcriptional regulator
MSPRPDVSEERKDQILDAASDVFAEKGLHEARMDDIVEKSGLSKGSLYWYFKSKDDIIIALLGRLFEREFSNLRGLQTAEGSALERLIIFSDSIIDDLKNWLRLVPIAYEFLGLIFRRKIVQQTFRQYMRTYLELLTPLIQEGIDNGEFRPLDAGEVAIAAGAIYEGTILLWVYDSTSIDVERHIRAGINLLIEGIKA